MAGFAPCAVPQGVLDVPGCGGFLDMFFAWSGHPTLPIWGWEGCD